MNTLRERSRTLEPVMRIGKKGVNDSVIKEIEKLLKKRKLIKIKILQNCELEKESVVTIVCSKTNSQLVSKIGSVFCIYKK